MTSLTGASGDAPRRPPNLFLRMLSACRSGLAAWHAHQRRALELGLRFD
jgi:hypothetical protein